jgi:hypothetical protein
MIPEKTVYTTKDCITPGCRNRAETGEDYCEWCDNQRVTAFEQAEEHDRKAARHINPVEYMETSASDDPMKPRTPCKHPAQARGTIHGKCVCLMCMQGVA